MGRWMEIVRPGPPPEVVAEQTPHPLIYAGYAVPAKYRDDFPTIMRVRAPSRKYVNEELVLQPAEASHLLEEVRRLRRVCAGEEFLPPFDGRGIYDEWRAERPEAEFAHHLDAVEALLERAVLEELVVRLLL